MPLELGSGASNRWPCAKGRSHRLPGLPRSRNPRIPEASRTAASEAAATESHRRRIRRSRNAAQRPRQAGDGLRHGQDVHGAAAVRTHRAGRWAHSVRGAHHRLGVPSPPRMADALRPDDVGAGGMFRQHRRRQRRTLRDRRRCAGVRRGCGPGGHRPPPVRKIRGRQGDFLHLPFAAQSLRSPGGSWRTGLRPCHRRRSPSHHGHRPRQLRGMGWRESGLPGVP